MKQKVTGIFSILLATVIWGASFVAQSAGMDLIGPFTFQAVRCLLAVLALLITTWIADIRSWKRFREKWTNPKLWKAGIICGLALFISTNLQQVALLTTDAGKAGFLTALYIVFVPILGIFRKKKPSIASVVSVLIAVVGMYLLCCTTVTGLQIGDILLVCSAAVFALQITLIEIFGHDADPLRLNCIQALVVTVLSSIPALLLEAPDMGLITRCWLPLTFSGVLSMGAAYSLQIIGQQKLDATPAALIMSLESVFAALFGAWLLQETMTVQEMIGCGLMFAAVILSQVHIPMRRKTPSI